MSRARHATYRVQLTPEKGFAAVVDDLARLALLGISHLYLSPIAEAIPGSTHGYDVVDHTAVRTELGGLDGLTALLDAADRDGLGVIVDHVPNHASIARPELNAPWWTMLRDGPESPAARWFDVDWALTAGQVILPVLADPLDEIVASGRLHVDLDGGEPTVRLGEQRWPLAAGTADLPLPDLLSRQHYRLAHWLAPDRNVRRFFTIDDLAAVCVEHDDVARAVDTLPRLLTAHPAFDGVRVDHVDGLAAPGGYLDGLREVIGHDRWLLVEKILAPHEVLPASWPVDGTTGYEHARVVEHALLDATGVATLTAAWRAVIGDPRPLRDWEDEARREVLARGLAPDLARTVAAGRDLGLDTDAVIELSVHLDRYRTYLPGDVDGRAAVDTAAASARTARPDLDTQLDELVAALTGDADAARELRTRWQQLTGPATAKGVEDRAFFRYVPVPTLCEVGGNPDPAADVDRVAELHARHEVVARRWPSTLLAGTTHDTKRSEDVRARGLAVCERAGAFVAAFDEWTRLDCSLLGDVDSSMAWLALHTAVTASPSTERLSAFLVKCAREADLRTSWADPDKRYESWLDDVAATAVRAVDDVGPLRALTANVAARGAAISLAMLAVRCTAPGVPDVYQGTEAARFLLVDPDNRAEPDRQTLDAVVAKAATLDLPTALAEPGAPCARAVVLTRLLALRRHEPTAFGPDSGYQPLPILIAIAPQNRGAIGMRIEESGGEEGAAIAFARLDASNEARVVTVTAREPVTVELPEGSWHDVLGDGSPPHTGSVTADGTRPVVLHRRTTS